ncbi:MAG TPA: ATP-binding cassette domain-containing protein [Flavihumibacter sp.]|nr:ATP-binding cassette domain-containing protein [Bacteroidota bacterium]HQD10256.1 ATP-binding cassette domain-containing protein [Flavihumibacter sp.]
MQPVVSLRGLEKSFNGFKAVDGLGFDVYPGDIYGFLGQNGAGKSTTLRILLSLIRPDAGAVSLFGMNLLQHRKECLQKVGAVIEKPDVYTYLSAYDNLAIFARLNGIRPRRQQLMEQLDTVGLADRAASKVKTFSQGMKQRLGIAVALVHNPALVVLDEPTNGLDPQGIADIRNLVLHLCREQGKTVLVSSHLLAEIEQVATRMIIIDKGKMLVEGKVSDLFDPAQSRVLITVSDPVRARQFISHQPWQAYLKTDQPGDNQLLFRMPKEQIPVLNRELVMAGIDVHAIDTTHSLEAYFLSITTGKQHVADFTH